MEYKTKFSMSVIFVKNIAISKKFYQDIFDLKIEHDFRENIVFKNSFSLWQKYSAKKIIFNSPKYKDSDEGTQNIELYFETDSIENILVKIKGMKVKIIHEIKEESWGQKTLRFFDPDNFIIEVAEPMELLVIRLFDSKMSFESISKKTQMPLDIVKKIILNIHPLS